MYIKRENKVSKILSVSCPYGNLQSSCYTILINGYRKFTT